jgi:hypothetical protein
MKLSTPLAGWVCKTVDVGGTQWAEFKLEENAGKSDQTNLVTLGRP